MAAVEGKSRRWQDGEAVKASPVPRDGTQDTAKIIARARESMSYCKAPTYVEFRDMLPPTGTGKVSRQRLKSTP